MPASQVGSTAHTPQQCNCNLHALVPLQPVLLLTYVQPFMFPACCTVAGLLSTSVRPQPPCFPAAAAAVSCCWPCCCCPYCCCLLCMPQPSRITLSLSTRRIQAMTRMRRHCCFLVACTVSSMRSAASSGCSQTSGGYVQQQQQLQLAAAAAAFYVAHWRASRLAGHAVPHVRDHKCSRIHALTFHGGHTMQQQDT